MLVPEHIDQVAEAAARIVAEEVGRAYIDPVAEEVGREARRRPEPLSVFGISDNALAAQPRYLGLLVSNYNSDIARRLA